MDYGFVLRCRLSSRPIYDAGNFFQSASEGEIVEAEGLIGVRFSLALRAFYLQVGYGFLRFGEGGKVASTFNRILSPRSAAAAYLGESEAAPPEGFGPGELPVVEVAEEDFLVMRPWGDRPDAVYGAGGVVLASDFMEFVMKLVYEDPEFFLRR